MFFSIALKPFVKKNKPDKNNEKASKQVLNEYLDLLPKPLLELWRKHGFGFYGDYQFRLINPSHWQATADQWVISDDETQRTPIAITAMGELIIYRKMSDAEDIMLLDPVNSKSHILNYSLIEFFNSDLCDSKTKDELLQSNFYHSSVKTEGVLQGNEIYSVDQMLLQMEMLKVEKVDAFDFYTNLFSKIETNESSEVSLPKTVGDAIPAQYRDTFAEIVSINNSVYGLYASHFLDEWFKVLSLDERGIYQLLFWKRDEFTGEDDGGRYYTGQYSEQVDEKTEDELLRLDIKLNGDSLGSDARDENLVVARSTDKRFLFQVECLGDYAENIDCNGMFQRGESVFEKVNIDSPLPQDGYEDDSMIPKDSWPVSLSYLLK